MTLRYEGSEVVNISRSTDSRPSQPYVDWNFYEEVSDTLPSYPSCTFGIPYLPFTTSTFLGLTDPPRLWGRVGVVVIGHRTP